MKKSVRDLKMGDKFVLRNDLHLGMIDTCDEMLKYCGKTLTVEYVSDDFDYGHSVNSSTWCWYDEHIDWDATNELYEKEEEQMTSGEPTRTANITKNLGDDDVKMSFLYDNREERVEYTVNGGDIDYVPNMINHYVQFLTHLGFSEEVVLKLMKQYILNSEI